MSTVVRDAGADPGAQPSYDPCRMLEDGGVVPRTRQDPASDGGAGTSLATTDPTMERLEDQISWYDRKSVSSQRWFKAIKIAVMVLAATIPFSAGLGAPAYLTGGLGVLIVILEGLLQLNQYQHNWITYRSTCEALKHEKYLYLANASPYAGDPNPHTLLAERLESLISQEHAKWASARQPSAKSAAERAEAGPPA